MAVTSSVNSRSAVAQAGNQGRRVTQHGADDSYRNAVDHHHGIGRQQRVPGAPVEHVGADVGHATAAPGVLEERAGPGVAAVQQPQQLLRSGIELVIPRCADDVAGIWLLPPVGRREELGRHRRSGSCSPASRFRNPMAGSFCSSRVIGGLAPSRSPAWMIRVPAGSRARSDLRYAARTAAPPAGRLPSGAAGVRRLPWKSLKVSTRRVTGAVAWRAAAGASQLTRSAGGGQGTSGAGDGAGTTAKPLPANNNQQNQYFTLHCSACCRLRMGIVTATLDIRNGCGNTSA